MGSLPVKPNANAIVVDPRDPKIVFVAGASGVFRSTDAGLNWEPRGQGLRSAETPASAITVGADVVALALNSTQPDTLFAATAEGLLYRSDDAAQSWKPVSMTSSR